IEATTAPTNGLIASYFFDGNANDSTGTANGVVSGALPTADRFGKPNGAYAFNGVSDFISASASALPTTERTVALWINPSTLTSRPCPLAYGGATGSESWLMCVNASGLGSFRMSSHNGTNAIDYPYPTAPVGRWFHFVVTTDSSGTKLYVNGVERARNTSF